MYMFKSLFNLKPGKLDKFTSSFFSPKIKLLAVYRNKVQPRKTENSIASIYGTQPSQVNTVMQYMIVQGLTKLQYAWWGFNNCYSLMFVLIVAEPY